MSIFLIIPFTLAPHVTEPITSQDHAKYPLLLHAGLTVCAHCLIPDCTRIPLYAIGACMTLHQNDFHRPQEAFKLQVCSRYKKECEDLDFFHVPTWRRNRILWRLSSSLEFLGSTQNPRLSLLNFISKSLLLYECDTQVLDWDAWQPDFHIPLAVLVKLTTAICVTGLNPYVLIPFVTVNTALVLASDLKLDLKHWKIVQTVWLWFMVFLRGIL